MKYNAFISYSHAADGKMAPALQSALEKFAKPWFKLRNLNVFRDEASLSVSPHLWTNIQEALGTSEYLIYLASPISAKSPWVNKEIEYWLEHKSIETLLIALTDGNIIYDEKTKAFHEADTNALPPILENAFDFEPFYIDLKSSRTTSDLTLKNPIFNKEVLKLAAQLHGKAPKDLASEEVKNHKKMIWTRNIAAMLLISLFGYALYSTKSSLDNFKEAQQKELIILENEKELEKRQLENRIKSDSLRMVADSLNHTKEQKQLSDELASTQEKLKMQMLENTRAISAKTLSINEEAKALVNQINKEKFEILNKLKIKGLNALGLSNMKSEVILYFDFDKASLNIDAINKLDSVIGYLKANPKLSLIIEMPFSKSFAKGSFKQWLEQCIELSSSGDTGEGYGSVHTIFINDSIIRQNREDAAPMRNMDEERWYKWFQERKVNAVKSYLEYKGLGENRIEGLVTNTVFIDDLLDQLEKTRFMGDKEALLQKWDYLKLHIY